MPTLASNLKQNCFNLEFRARVETPEIQHERAETVKNKTVAELSQINSLSEFPLPKQIENLLHTDIKLNKLLEKPR